ncbi:MAG: hypothetical protein K1Y36_05180 [Blastocatellia bacterium]|nr:hypothetical protein [Blastocatellia bacterium]
MVTQDPRSTFHVTREGTATRCEICHQSDLYDPETNLCGRCQPLVDSRLIQIQPAPEAGSPTPFDDAVSDFFRPELSLTDFFRLVRAAGRLHSENFGVFVSLQAVVDGLLAISLWFGTGGSIPPVPAFSPFAGGAAWAWLLDVFFGSLATTLGIGAFAAITQEHPNVMKQAVESLRHRSGGFFLAAFLGRLYQKTGVLLCWPVGFATVATGAFLPETAFFGTSTGFELFRRSRILGGRNWLPLCGMSIVHWLLEIIPAALVWNLSHEAYFWVYLIFRALVSPFFQILHTLLYLHLALQSPAPSMIAEPTAAEDEFLS